MCIVIGEKKNLKVQENGTIVNKYRLISRKVLFYTNYERRDIYEKII